MLKDVEGVSLLEVYVFRPIVSCLSEAVKMAVRMISPRIVV